MTPWMLVVVIIAPFVIIGFSGVAFYFITKMACRRFDHQDDEIADLRDQLDALAREA